RAVDGSRLHGEDRSNRDIRIDVRRTIERIDGNEQRRTVLQNDDLVELLRDERGNRRRTEARDDQIVRENIELLLRIACAVIPARSGEGPGKSTGADDLGDSAAGMRERLQSRSNVFASRVAAGPVGEMFFECDAAAHWRLPLWSECERSVSSSRRVHRE